MKRFILLLVLLLLACGKGELVDDVPADMPEASDDQITDDSMDTAKTDDSMDTAKTPEPIEKVVEESPEPKVVAPIKKENSPEVKALLSKYEDKIESYEFYYAPPPDNLARDQYFISGDKVRVELFDKNYASVHNYFDTVFLDLKEKTAKKYCLRGQTLCKGFEQGQTIAFEEYALQFPHEYIDQIEHAELSGSETLYDRRTLKVSYELGGTQHYAWIDEFSGLPVRIQKGEKKDAPKWEFRSLGINSVSEEEVTFTG